MPFSRRFQAILLVLILGSMAYRPAVDVMVDWLWFDALGYLPIFTVSLTTKVTLWVSGFALSALFILANVRQASRDTPLNYARISGMMGEQGMPPEQLRSLLRLLVLVWVLVPSLMFGSTAASFWLELLTWKNAVPFDVTDPVFGKDIGFYVFQLPVLSFAQDALVGLIFITLVPLSGFYALRDLSGITARPELSDGARAHLLGLAALLLILVGCGWWLDRYDLLFDRTGVVWGAGYTDLNARLPAYTAMAGLSVLLAVTMLVATVREGWRLPMGGAALYLVARVVGVGLVPGWVQDWVVKPSELTLERAFLERNIEATRAAYNLDKIDVKPFEASTDLTMGDIEANPLTVENIRLWDGRPLLDTYSQLQEIRLYYDFVDVDVDRYEINGSPRQVMLSARELNYNSLQERTWVNEHFQYTHGYGLTMSPVNVVTREGLPELFIKDLPPVSKVGPQVTRPEIYYGELTDRYVFVRTGAEEFDYPLGDQNVYTTYEGKGGVPIGSSFDKLLFSMHFNNLSILLSSYLQDDSRVMFRRQIKERVRHLAPFLTFDHDPYLVVADERLFWVIDAYTTTDGYPYAQPTATSSRRRFNYIRNSVKVVVDAYHGSVSFYVADAEDPIVRVYERIFPGSFEPLSAMPEGLREHVRYPVDYFNVQATMYRAYHMTDPTVFYNKEDMWELPREMYGGQDQQMEAYYLIMKLPEEENAEFILLIPFVPTNRDNMISWLAARCDPDVYGRLVLYQFPKQKLIYGPRQIEARIDQDPDISQQITLWSQSGSRVVRGNLLVIPLGDSLIYVEPLYLQAETSKLPELKRVIVSYENHIAMRPTLDEALAAVFEAEPPPTPLPSEGGVVLDAPPADSAAWRQLAHQADQAFQDALSRQRAGDWAGYGEAIGKLEGLLGELRGLSREEGASEGAVEPEASPE